MDTEAPINKEDLNITTKQPEVEIDIIDVDKNTKKIPDWFDEYNASLKEKKSILSEEIDELSKMDPDALNKRLGGDISELPYELLNKLFIDGSEDDKVVEILRKKREDWRKKKKLDEPKRNVIGFDGRVISEKDWEDATDSEKRGFLVGSTCFHYNSDTPGMDSSPEDRF